MPADSEYETLEDWAGAIRQSLYLVFTDIVYSTDLNQCYQDDVWLRKIKRHFAKGREYCKKHDGYVVKVIGDGMMCVFRTARTAVDFSSDFYDDPGSRYTLIRVGVHGGDVSIHDNDIYGLAVNQAARVQSTLDYDGICLTAVVKENYFNDRGIHGPPDIQLTGKTPKNFPDTKTFVLLTEAKAEFSSRRRKDIAIALGRKVDELFLSEPLTQDAEH